MVVGAKMFFQTFFECDKLLVSRAVVVCMPCVPYASLCRSCLTCPCALRTLCVPCAPYMPSRISVLVPYLSYVAYIPYVACVPYVYCVCYLSL